MQLRILGFCFLFLFFTQSLVADFLSLEERLHKEGHSYLFPKKIHYDLTIQSKTFHLNLLTKEVFSKHKTTIEHADLHIQANSMKYDVVQNAMTVKQDVVIKKKDMNLHCHVATAYIPDKVKAKGDVVFDFKDYNGTSLSALYEIKNQWVTLYGDVELKQKGDFIRGNVVKFDMKDEKLISEGRSKVKLSTKRLKK